MHKNLLVEICACKGGTWLRLSCTAVSDDCIEAQKSMLEAYPSLKGRYQPGDGSIEV